MAVVNVNKISEDVLIQLKENNVNVNSREYKLAFSNMIKTNFYEKYFDFLENGGKIYNGEISDFCSEYLKYGFSENYMRAVLVPAILQDFGSCIE